MKKLSILCFLLTLSACTTATGNFCALYEGQLPSSVSKEVQTKLYVKENGLFEQEVFDQTTQKKYYTKGFYTVKNNILNTYTKNKKTSYKIKENQLELIHSNTKKAYTIKCK